MAWPYPPCLAHRGGGCLAPENTLLALEAGWRCGYRAAEVDAALTADAVPVLMHDATLERTTDGKGNLAQHTAAQIERLDAGRWFGAGFAGVRVPRLAAVLEFCRARGIWLNIEIKPVPGTELATGEEVARLVADFWRQPGTTPAPLLSSFSPSALAAAQMAAPGLARGLLCRRIAADWERALRDLDAASLHCDHRALDPILAARVRAAGYGLLCYTVNHPQRARTLWRWGVDAICTDRIDRIQPSGANSV